MEFHVGSTPILILCGEEKDSEEKGLKKTDKIKGRKRRRRIGREKEGVVKRRLLSTKNWDLLLKSTRQKLGITLSHGVRYTKLGSP